MRKLLFLSTLLPFVFSCGKEPENKIVIPPPSEKAPTSITLSSASLAPAQAGESFTLTITSPAKPAVSTPPEWIGITLGAYAWDAGGRDNPGQEKHPYINHTTGEFMTLGREPIETVVKAWTTNDATYTLQSVYDRAPVF